MDKSIKEIQKRGRGRPATGRDTAVTSRLSERTILAVDEWAVENGCTRAEAIRGLVEIGLSASPRKRTRTTDKARKAASIAAENAAMDHMHRVLKDHLPAVIKARTKQLTTMPGGVKKR